MDKISSQLTIAETKELLRYIIKNNMELAKKGLNTVAINIEGETGLGKTSAIKQLHEELNMPYEKKNLAQIDELAELLGFSIRQFKLCKNTKGSTNKKMIEGKLIEVTTEAVNECRWIDENSVKQYTDNGYVFSGEKRTAYCPPSWIADKIDPMIFLLDDYSRAETRFQQAIMEIVDRGEYMSWSLPKGSTVILTSNPDNSEYQVTTLDDAQSSRMAKVSVKFDIACWLEWAQEEGIDGRAQNFLALNPELVTTKCNPRSIVSFYNLISGFEVFEDNLEKIQLLGEGTVGPEFTSMFITFIHNKLDRLIKPEDMLHLSAEKTVIDRFKSCVGEGDDYRADIASVLCNRFINYTLHYAKSNSISPDIIQRLKLFGTDESLLTNDLQYVLIKSLLAKAKQKFQKLIAIPEIIQKAIK